MLSWRESNLAVMENTLCLVPQVSWRSPALNADFATFFYEKVKLISSLKPESIEYENFV